MEKNIHVPISREDAESLRAGDYVYLTGTIYTARDAAHKRMKETLDAGKELPLSMDRNVIYYMGPSPAREGRPIGSAGPTTASRMDKYAPELLDLGLGAMIGKGKRSPAVADAIVRNGAVYFAAIGGAGALLSKCIVSSEVIAYGDLGPEAVRKLEVKDFPVVVVIDSQGNNLYETAAGRMQRKDDMNRIAYMVIKSLPFVPAWFYRVCRLGRDNDPHTEQERYDYLRKLVKRVNKSGRVTIEVHGRENLPAADGFIMFPNHQGLFDVLAVIEGCPHPFGVVIKKEAADIILVKQVVKLLRGLSIDRKDTRSSLKLINQMTEEVGRGRNYLIFPEGTRSRKGNELLEFKAGTFKSAVNARCPIVPVALIDSFRPFDIHSIKKETVQVHFLEPIGYDQYIGMKTTEIAHLVHDRIQEEINKFI